MTPARRDRNSPARLGVAGRRIASLLGILALAGALSGCDSGDAEQALAHYERAKEFHASGDLRSSVIELKNALQLDPENGEARWLLGQTQLELGHGDAARKEFERVRDLGLNKPGLNRAMVRALLMQGEYGRALAEVEIYAAGANDASWQVLRGDAALGLRKLDQARTAYDAAIALEPGNPEARRGLAKLGLAGGDTEAAKVEIDKALEASDADFETWILKGEMELSLERYDDAEASFQRALGLSENNAAATIGLTRAYIGQNRPDEAARQLEPLAKQAEKDPRINYLRALIARQNNDIDAAARYLREVLSVAPNHAPTLFLMGQIHYLRREFEQAQNDLTRHLAAVPGNYQARKILGAVLIELRQPAKAIEVLKAAEHTDGEDAQLLAMLGTAYMSNGEADKGREYLDRASALAPQAAPIRTQLAVSHLASGDAQGAVNELQAAVEADPEFSRADVLLVLTHIRNQEFDKALAAAQALVDKKGDAPAAHNLLGAAYEGKGETEKAKASYRKALELNPNYITAELNLARLDLAAGDIPAAKKRYESVLEHEGAQHHPVALVALAKIASDEGRTQESLALLERARERNPTAVEPRLILGNYYLRQGKVTEALDIVLEAKAAAPGNLVVLLTLARSQIAANQVDNAISTLRTVIERAPKAPDGYFNMAIALSRKGDHAGAVAQMRKVVELQPDNRRAQALLGQALLRDEAPGEALMIASELKKAEPDSPAGLVLEGDVLMSQRKAAEALAAYRTAFGKTEVSPLLMKVYQAQRASGDADGAVALLDDWLRDHPDDMTVRLAYAAAVHEQGRVDDAREQYEAVLAAQPDNIIVLNNLAWIYFNQHDERAMQYAKRAYDRVPGRAEIADTYGWLLVQDGKVEQGLAILAKAAQGQPANGDIVYHYAAALARAGDNGGARRALEKILVEGKKFPERGAAEGLLRQIQ